MPQINQLNTLDNPNDSDLLPIYSQQNGDARKVSVGNLRKAIESGNAQTEGFLTQYSFPAGSGFTTLVVSSKENIWLILRPTAPFNAGTIKLPPQSDLFDGQRIIVNTTEEILNLTIDGNGANLSGQPVMLAKDGSLELRYDAGSNIWYRVSGTASSALAVTYQPAGAGAVATTVRAKLREFVSVKDFGAVGDGVTDDTVALQAAVTASTGRELRFPTGTYLVSSTLVLPSNTFLVGEGPSSVIRLANGANTHVFQNSNYLSGSNDNIVFDRLVIDGNTANQTNNGAYNKHGIRMRGVSDLVVRNCEIRNVGTDAINLINCTRPSICNNHIYGAYNHAVAFENTHGLLGESNNIHDCGSKTDAFGFTSSGHAFIGVNVACNNARIVNNYVCDMGDSCLRNGAAGEGWVIANNLVINSGKDSIKIMGKTIGGTRFLTVASPTGFSVNDTITAGGGSTATGTITAVNGSVLTVTMGGVVATYQSFCLGDTVTSTPGGGNSTITKIESEMAKANVVSNNVIIDAGNSGIVANGDIPTIITGNVIRGTGKNTAGAGTSKWFSSASGIQVTDNSSDFQISNNVVSEAYASGITMDNAYRVSIRGNKTSANGANGFYFNQCDGLTIENNESYDNGTRLTNQAGIRFISAGSMAAAYSRHCIRFNRCYSTGAGSQQWGIRLDQGSGTVSNSLVQFNDLFGNSSAAQLFTNWSGSGNRIGQNTGYVTENRGTATILAGTTSIAVPHGCNITPAASQLSVTPLSFIESSVSWYTVTPNSTKFTILLTAAPPTDRVFSWQIQA